MKPEESLASDAMQAGDGVSTLLGCHGSQSRRLFSPGMCWGTARFIMASIALAWHQKQQAAVVVFIAFLRRGVIHIHISWGKAGGMLGTSWESLWLGQGVGMRCTE